MVAWGPIIGAGISAIGSLFGGDDDEETTTTVNYRQMARAAEKAGFNPLTAIRNGGSAGFTTTHHPALSSQDRFGQAFQVLGNALMSFDARADERAALEDRLMQAQIDNLNRTQAAASTSFAMDTPSAAGASVVNAAGRPVNPPLVGPARPYGEPVPLYKTVFWFDENGQRHEQHIANIDAVPDDPSGLLVPPVVRIGGDVDRTRVGPQTTAPWRPPLKTPALAPVRMPDLLQETEDWFKPWKGVLW